jgi:mycofactocin precursor
MHQFHREETPMPEAIEPQTSTAEPAVPLAPEHDTSGVSDPDADLVEADVLVEDVSIDGMCGVY